VVKGKRLFFRQKKERVQKTKPSKEKGKRKGENCIGKKVVYNQTGPRDQGVEISF